MIKKGGNNLIGTVTSEIGYLTNLTVLGLRSNELSGTIPTQLGSLAQLQVLGLSSNKLSGTIPTQLGSLAQLQHLGLSGNILNGTAGDLSFLCKNGAIDVDITSNSNMTCSCCN